MPGVLAQISRLDRFLATTKRGPRGSRSRHHAVGLQGVWGENLGLLIPVPRPSPRESQPRVRAASTTNSPVWTLRLGWHPARCPRGSPTPADAASALPRRASHCTILRRLYSSTDVFKIRSQISTFKQRCNQHFFHITTVLAPGISLFRTTRGTWTEITLTGSAKAS